MDGQLSSRIVWELVPCLCARRRMQCAQRLEHPLNTSTATFGEEIGATKGKQASRKDIVDTRKIDMYGSLRARKNNNRTFY